MKVLQVIDSLAPQGAETLVCQLSHSLRDVGIASDIYAFRRTGSLLEAECQRGGVSVHYSNVKNLHSPRQIGALRSHVQAHRYDLIHVHLYPAQLWAAMAANWDNWTVPLVTTEHSTTNRRRKLVFKPVEAWMYRQYNAVIGVSKATTSSLASWLGLLSDRMVTIYNGVRLSSISSIPSADLKRELGITNECLAISVGRCEWPKNFECLIRATARVPGLHLAVVGDGVLLPLLRALATSLGVAGRVHFVGRRNDVIALLKGADFYVQGSRWEGCSMAALEAMAVGLPMVTSRVPGLTDVVADAGLTFESDDDSGLGACMSRLLKNPESRSILGQASRTRALLFELSRTTREHVDLYRSLLS